MNRNVIVALLIMTLLGANGCGPSCDDFDRSAHDAIEENRACETEADCQALRVFVSCVPGIECWTSVSADADTNAIGQTILDASNDRRLNGCGCTQPECEEAMPPVMCVAGRCEVGP